jgi:hypothetical protein
MADEASNNEAQPGAGEPYEDAEQELADKLDQDLFRRTLREFCGLTPNQLDAFYGRMYFLPSDPNDERMGIERLSEDLAS